MKKLLILLVPVAFLFGCNAELTAEQVKAQYGKQCQKQLVKQFFDEAATEEQKEKFCDCYTDYLLDGKDVTSVGEIIKKSTKIEELTTAMEDCSTMASGDEMEDKEMMDKEEMEEESVN